MTATAAPSLRQRQHAEERRDQVIEAAIAEFAVNGYTAASTAAIAKRAGISQPYIYALFPSKLDLFLAAHDRVIGAILTTFREAVRGATSPEDALERMGLTYPSLISDRTHLLFQLQAHAAAGDPEIRAHTARAFQRLVDDVTALSGASPASVATFFACGMLANVTTILELPEICAPLWEGKVLP
ncbi:MAG: TetR/AcrR family transcriptional regulator [Candidatus Dormibacteraeota bacterium]|nr:TetR/AcrR family transcriptional regulator [Candidatus Dormibacteraeota bacterium]MBV8445698.1 TetR/AcrR family transcriptional regulator [Candidatus Dormibacteraeota bacterium]